MLPQVEHVHGSEVAKAADIVAGRGAVGRQDVSGPLVGCGPGDRTKRAAEELFGGVDGEDVAGHSAEAGELQRAEAAWEG